MLEAINQPLLTRRNDEVRCEHCDLIIQVNGMKWVEHLKVCPGRKTQ